MKLILSLVAGASLLALFGVVQADDHLFTAMQRGLADNPHTHAFTVNKAGHGGDLAPGQGSPFRGEDMQTPSTDNESANAHANIKPRLPK